MLEQARALEGAEVGLGVADVDDEQHRRGIMLGRPMPASAPKLYVVPGSHPCAAVEAALELQGLAYRRVDLLPLVAAAVGPLLYGGITVPGMRIDGERLAGSRAIMRRLDAARARAAAAAGAREPRYAPRAGGRALGRRGPPGGAAPADRRRLPAHPRAMESYADDRACRCPLALLRPTRR